ncbi:MAG: hypothetical protein KAU36_02930, partial [candidate division Zixibacteria bacterium]|nr:hypothetical protein [candidate division Zixibacteria bacterium]
MKKVLGSIFVTIGLQLVSYGPTSAAINHNEFTLIEQQSNHPQIIETVSPTAGNPWVWHVSGLNGFSAASSIWFEYENDGPGEANEDHTTALFYWSGFVSSDWQNGVDGSFTLTLSNGVDSDRAYTISLSLRSMVGG